MMKGMVTAMILTVMQISGNPKLMTEGIAATIAAEAAPDFDSQMDVASVIWKRAAKPVDAKSLIDACLKPGQFCCWQSGEVELREDSASKRVFGMAYAIASEMTSGKFVPTIQADFFIDGRLSGPPKEWGPVVMVKKAHGLTYYRRVK